MNSELQQYYDSLVDKDGDGTRYYFDVVAYNTEAKITNPLVSVAQNAKKATGAERFKEVVSRAEAAKYDLITVKEYSADGQTVISDNRFVLNNRNTKKNRGRNRGGVVPYQPQQPQASLAGFEDQLTMMGFTNGFQGVIDSSARMMTNEYKLQEQTRQINELTKKVEQIEQEKERLRQETETYKERYKEILDDKKEIERDYKREVTDLNQKLSFGSLAFQGALGLIASKTGLGNMLQGLMGTDAAQAAPVQPVAQLPVQPAQPPADADAQQYISYVEDFLRKRNTPELRLVATIIQFVELPGNLEALEQYCQQQYRVQQAQQAQTQTQTPQITPQP